MADPFVSEIRMFPFQFAPKGWAVCDGSKLPINQYMILYAVIGSNYGGDGVQFFSIPNLQDKAPLKAGKGPGLSDYKLGQTGGEFGVDLAQKHLPPHNHLFQVTNINTGDVSMPTNKVPAKTTFPMYQSAPTPGVYMAQNALTPAGNGNLHNNIQPYLAFNFCISLEGIYPQRG